MDIRHDAKALIEKRNQKPQQRRLNLKKILKKGGAYKVKKLHPGV